MDLIKDEVLILANSLNDFFGKIDGILSGMPPKGKGDGSPFTQDPPAIYLLSLSHLLWFSWRPEQPNLGENGPITELASLIYEIATGKEPRTFAKAIRVYRRRRVPVMAE
jgi:hypothetical protein